MPAPRQVSCGLDFSIICDLHVTLKLAVDDRFDFSCVPLAHPRFKREFSKLCQSQSSLFTRADLVVTSQDWSQIIVAKMSPYIDVDSMISSIRKQSEATLEQELNYVYHLGIPAIIVNLRGMEVENLAQIICSKLLTSQYIVWVHVPMISPATEAAAWRSDLDTADCKKTDSPWEWWNKFRTLCNYEKRVGLMLDVSCDLPCQEELDRWLGEPLKCISLSTSVFVTNKKGFPVLSRAHQAFIRAVIPLGVQVVIKGPSRHASRTLYESYLSFLWQEVSYREDPVSDFGRGFEDCLMCPLQPLENNLESHTYEIFEKDPVKYSEYGRAIYHALLDRTPMEEKATKVQTIMIVGAGRGPLVRAALSAAERADRKVKIYAVEKNPSAIITLLAQKEAIWGDSVDVVLSDMRVFDPPDKADILVSELLGSFGDNELSPECLDGSQRLLKADGISIPASYTSFICPVQSSKLYNEVVQLKDKEDRSIGRFETPYVVFQQNKYLLSKAQPLFTFHHPNHDNPIDNTRYKKLKFEIQQSSSLHGFSGFFETVLYKDISLSIVPETYSQGMFSWFPIYFPISVPVQLKKGDCVELHFWRKVSSTHVWYEWTVSSPTFLHIHNPAGRSYKIGL